VLQNLFSFKKNSNLLIIFLFCFSLFKSLVKLLSLLFLSRISTMPELPEVEAARQTAEEYLVNKTIVEANAVEDESAFFFFFFGLIEINGLTTMATTTQPSTLNLTSPFPLFLIPSPPQKSSLAPLQSPCAPLSSARRSPRLAGTAKTSGWSWNKEEGEAVVVRRPRPRRPPLLPLPLLPPRPRPLSCSTLA